MATAVTGKADERALERWTLALLGVFYAAAAFQPWGWPSVDGYPAIERWIDHGYLLNDFYTSTTAVYNVDTIQAALFGTIQKLTGVHYDVSLAALNFLRCLAWPLVVFEFFRAMTGNRLTAIAGATLGTISLFLVPDLLAWGWVWGDPSTALFAIMFMLIGWTMFLDRRPAAGMLVLVLVALAHPLMAVHGGLFVALIFFVDYSGREKIAALKSPAAWLSGVLFAFAFGAQYRLLSAAPNVELPVTTYANILAFIRHPTDFIPSLFPVEDWLAAGLSTAAAITIFWSMRRETQRFKLIVAGLAAYFALCAAGFFWVEVHPIRFFVDLIPYRSVVISAPLMLLAYAQFANAELRDKHYFSSVILAALFFAVAAAPKLHFPHTAALALIAIFIIGRIAAGRPQLGAAEKMLADNISSRRLLAGMALTLSISAPFIAFLRGNELVIPRLSNQHAFYRWAHDETPDGAVFLVDRRGSAIGAAIDPQRTRLVARRAVAASMDFPFLEQDIVAWNDRWQTLLGGGAENHVSRADPAELAAAAAKFPFDYVVRSAPLREDPRFSLVKTFDPERFAGKIYVYHFNAAAR